MSYLRVIPRDLFNEANLLKCYGQLYLNLERLNLPNVEIQHDGESFDVQQDPESGDLFLSNVRLVVNDQPCRLSRPLNSRAPWPLLLLTESNGVVEDEVHVFSDDGAFSLEMHSFIGWHALLAA